MAKKPTYEDLQQKIKSLENEITELTSEKDGPAEIDHLKNLLKFAPYGFFLIDISSNGKIIACNDKGAKRLGTTVKKAIGTILKDYFPPDIAKQRQEKSFEAVKTKKPVSFEDQVDDRYYYNTIHPIPDNQGNITKLAVYGSDITEIKKTESKMQEIKERYKAIFNRSMDCFFVADLEGNFLDANDAALNLMGYKREDIPSLSFTSLLSDDQLPLVIEAFEELIQTGTQKAPLDLKLYKKSGDIVHVETMGSVINKDGSPYAMQGIARDVSDRKITEQALRESEEKYRTILDNIEEGYYEVDLAGNFTFFNNALLKALGYKKSELIGMNNREYMDTENAKKVFNVFNDVYKTGKPAIAYDWILITKEGATRYIEASSSLMKDANEKPIGFRGMVRDVTQRKEAEQALSESEKKYRDILDNMVDAYIESDLRGNNTFVNRSAYERMGYSKEEYLGMNYKEYTTPENAKILFETYNQVYKTGKPLELAEYELITKDGHLLICEASITLRKDAAGEPIGFRALSRDITEKRRLEEQFQQAQKLEAVGTLAGGIAHDFNNLLMGILGRSSLMMADFEPSHPYVEHLKEVETYVKNAVNLTNQLLGFARGGKYEPKPTNINELIKNHNRMFGRTKKEIKIHGKYDDKIWATEVDRGQIEQVLMNIYVNAWQAMPDGGDLYIATENMNLDEDYCEPFEISPGKYVRISITDTGIGMDSDVKDKIFDPFFTTKEKERGTGMGLSSAYGIIKNHRGIINVYSERGQGATFNIYLPSSKKKVKKEKTAEEKIAKGSGTILLIDDEEMIVNVGEKILKRLGYDVLTASDGKQGVDIYKQKKDDIDMVILDLIMPDMPGKETFEALAKINPNIKVLLASGYSLDGKAKEILDRGCNGFIQKPFNMEQLSLKVQEILKQTNN